MVSHSLNSAYSDGGLQVLWEDGERIFRRGSRLDDNGKRRAVLIVLPAADYPSRSSLDRLTHEYELKHELDGAWAVRPLDLVRDGGRTTLVLEDAGGEPLDRLLGVPMEMGRFLGLAIGIAGALGKLHQRGLVHKDIKPANILVNGATGEVRLTGFGIASRLARERQSPHPPETIAGTLAYMAPEQTGRMNRSIDSRSDLYALGATFYQMLTGALPFSAADPMEWVHCHLARQPVAPGERLKEIPGAVSAIVMRLLAKRAEDRYQTAAGLESDLRRCQTEWEVQRRIDDFPLGEHDMPDRLLIPEKLYGRRREVETLLASFDDVVASGTTSLVLVSGPPGIGKSSVVHELHKVLVSPRGLFTSAKFDQLKRDIPYATLAQAFQSLIRRLLSQPEAELSAWRDDLRQALDPNGALVAELIPELKFIIGEQVAVPDLAPPDAKARFQLALRQLISVFARAERPLALFLDDLQWLDAATLDLLEDVLVQRDLHHLLLVGAYRDTEVDASHPLMRTLAGIREKGAAVQEIVLAPLNREDLVHLITDTVHCEPQRAIPLAALVHQKTAGNPFFANQFIQELVEEGSIKFDSGRASWLWDLGSIKAKAYTDNVVDLMVGKLSRLPLITQEALKDLACLGNVAETSTLSVARGTSEEDVHSDLWEARRAELIVRSQDSYHFVHDRVREAAYSLIPEQERAQAHLRIGRLLMARIEPEKRDDALFEIAGHLNRGSALMASLREREELAALNLMAGKRAKTAGAYASALNYFIAAAPLLPQDGWERRHDLLFELELHRAACEFMTGGVTPAQDRLVALSRRATNTVERGSVACLLADVHFSRQRPDLGLTACLECLRHAGLDFPKAPTDGQARAAYESVLSKLDSRSIDELVNLPLMTDRVARATMDVLMKVIPCAASTDKNLLSLIVCAAIDLSLTHGNCDGSCFAYQFFGFVAGGLFGNFAVGFRFGRVGGEVVERTGLHRFDAVVRIFLANQAPWARHGGTSGQLLRSALDIAMRTGDPVAAAASSAQLVWHALVAGEPLVEAEKEAEAAMALHGKLGFGALLDSLAMQRAYIRNLRGLTRQFGSLDDDHFDERCWTSRESTPQRLPILECRYWVRRLQARLIAGDYVAALDASIRAQDLLWATPALFVRADCEFYGALARAAACDPQPVHERPAHLQALAAHGRRLDACARECPENFQDRAALVNAEIARIEGRDHEATRLYEEAIRSACANGFIHHEALALELAARFYATRGFDRIAKAYLRDARSCYLQWGADGKVRQLDELDPYLREEDQRTEPTRTRETPIEQLDLAAVLKVLQAVSGETDLGRLIATIMRLGMEHAGAERGLLILPRDGGYRVEAEAGIGSDAVTVVLRESSITAETLPQSAFDYVLRTRETVLLHDASAENTSDPYVRQRRPRSVLCMPLLKQTRMVGVLYLENSLTSGVFTPTRMALLKLLASEAAISIENARLYRDLAERESRIRRLVDANIIGIFIWELEGRILEANDAFLTMVGYDREDVIAGRLNWTDLTPPEWRDRDERRWMPELKLSGTLQPFEKEYFRKDGSRVPVLIGVATFEETAHQGVAYVLDLTERKRAQDALSRAGAELAHVSRVTALSALTASIAHEVNQPLSGIITNASTCLRMLDTAPPDIDGARITARRTIRDGNRASDVVTRLRALFSKREFTLESLDLNEAAREVIALSSNELQRHRIILQSELADDLPVVTGDRIQLQQVIINLLRNAADAMADVQDRPRQLLIKTEREEHGDKARLTVRDAGVGLSAQSLNSLFAAFHTTKSGGMGIGLFVSRSIIERHHGRLWAEPNHEAPGATFSFSLPCGAEPGRDTVSASSAS